MSNRLIEPACAPEYGAHASEPDASPVTIRQLCTSFLETGRFGFESMWGLHRCHGTYAAKTESVLWLKDAVSLLVFDETGTFRFVDMVIGSWGMG